MSNRCEGYLQLVLPLPSDFSLQKAVCCYGFFMMAPNSWVEPSPAASGGFLQRPLRLVDGRSVQTRISESNHDLNVCLFGIQQLSARDKDFILAQISRMLRLSEAESSAIAAFHGLHGQAREEGFGRLFRSPTLFEDIIKSLLLCNCGWGRTLSMARALCELQAELKGPPLGCPDGVPKKVEEIALPVTPELTERKRKGALKKQKCSQACMSLKFDDMRVEGRTSSVRASSCMEWVVEGQLESEEDPIGCKSFTNAAASGSRTASFSTAGAFPSPEELCAVDSSFLAKRCGLGYRGMRIWKMAKDICDGVIDLQSLESEPPLQLEDARSKLLQLQGIGPFTCANILMCMGEYSIIPADSETIRHLKQVHGKMKCTVESVSKDVTVIYASFAPYQFLAYWYELWSTYEKRFGKLSSMDPRSYGRITGNNMRRKRKGKDPH